MNGWVVIEEAFVTTTLKVVVVVGIVIEMTRRWMVFCVHWVVVEVWIQSRQSAAAPVIEPLFENLQALVVFWQKDVACTLLDISCIYHVQRPIAFSTR